MSWEGAPTQYHALHAIVEPAHAHHGGRTPKPPSNGSGAITFQNFEGNGSWQLENHTEGTCSGKTVFDANSCPNYKTITVAPSKSFGRAGSTLTINGNHAPANFTFTRGTLTDSGTLTPLAGNRLHPQRQVNGSWNLIKKLMPAKNKKENRVNGPLFYFTQRTTGGGLSV